MFKLKLISFVGLFFVLNPSGLFAIKAEPISRQEVPVMVEKAFASKYPEAEEVEWDKQMSVYLVSFTLSSAYAYAVFSNQGAWISTEVMIDVSDLPAIVVKKAVKLLPDFEIGNVAKIEKSKAEVHYEVIMDSTDKSYSLIYSASGKLISRNRIAFEGEEQFFYGEPTL
jgi:hypothetical protein